MSYTSDYSDVVSAISQCDINYIVPINVKLSDKIYLENLGGHAYFAEYLLGSIGASGNGSTIIISDAHASLYEDIDQYISSTEKLITNFKNSSLAIKKYGSDLCFVANNLANYDYANVVAASMLATSEYKNYPLQDCGDAVFDIDYHDIYSKEFCFFKYNIRRSATIENFHNFAIVDDQYKFVPINRVVKALYKYLDLSDFRGHMYNTYKKVLIVDKLDTLLSSVTGVMITDYSITSCEFVKDKNTKTVLVLTEITIIPINSIEKYKLSIEVRNG